MKKKFMGFLLMLLAALGLALATILMKVIPQMTELLPSHVVIWRFIFAALTFWMIMLIRRSGPEERKPIPIRFLILGLVFGVSGFSAVFALNFLPSSIYIIILYIYPSLVVLYSLITGKSVPRLFWLGLPLTFVGLILTVFDFGSFLSIDPIGFFITILNALAMVAYIILSERYFGGGGSKRRGTRWMLTGALIFSLFWIPVAGIRLPNSGLGWLLVISLGILGTLVPLLSINIGLQLIGAARGSVIVTLQPVFTVLFSTIFLDETLSLQQWLGGVVVVAAIVLLQLSADSKAIVTGKQV